jgi:methylated-DNA-[protein]-cysteine S-methyltransferase
MRTELQIESITSPIGTLLLVSDGTNLCALDYEDHEARMARLLADRYGKVQLVEKADSQGFAARVRSYLEGDLGTLDGIPVATGGTAFQRQVWAALRQIPPGTTTSYGALAVRIGHPGASRAVGLANSLNPVALVVPCHRVVGAGGALTGYAGGLERKRWLIAHEAARSSASR